MKKLFISFFSFIILLILCSISLYGVNISPMEFSYPIGNYELMRFENGFTITKQNTRFFYSFSPFNDYYITRDGTRNSLLSVDEIREHRFVSNYQRSKIQEIGEILLKYFDYSYPTLNFVGSTKSEYQAKVLPTRIQLTRAVAVPSGNIPLRLGSTMSYHGTDFVFDSRGTLYTFQTQEDIDFFETLYGIKLKLLFGDPRVKVAGKYVFIFNPSIAGVLRINATNAQEIWVNRNDRFIEVEEDAEPLTRNIQESILQITVLDNIQEAYSV